jgi:hypothetical protein
MMMLRRLQAGRKAPVRLHVPQRSRTGRLQSRHQPHEQRRQRGETRSEREDAKIQAEGQRQRRRLRLPNLNRRLERDHQIDQPRGEHQANRDGQR